MSQRFVEVGGFQVAIEDLAAAVQALDNDDWVEVVDAHSSDCRAWSNEEDDFDADAE